MPSKSCPVCGTNIKTFQPAGDARHHYECPHCQLIQMDGSHHLSPEKQKERYLEHNNTEENQGYVGMFEQFIDVAVDPFAEKGSRVLDFGCGPGPVLAGLLRKRGYSADTHDLFFDPDDKYQNQSYDVITLTEVLEHLTDPLETLRDLSQRLGSKGILAIMTLFHPNDRQAFSKWWYRKDPTHVSFFTLKTMGEMAKALGVTELFSDSKRVIVLGNKPKG